LPTLSAAPLHELDAARTRRFQAQEATLREEISFSDANGTSIHGNYELTNGVVTVTTADGLSKTADVDNSMLSPETLAKMLLLQMHQQGDAEPQPPRHGH
jgi:hypothetical protein